ncbi:4293_t:CDS:1, partial [Ambispora gerdemannii]
MVSRSTKEVLAPKLSQRRNSKEKEDVVKQNEDDAEKNKRVTSE